MQNGELRVVLVGAGEMGTKVHAPVWAAMPGAKLVGVVDPVPERVRLIREKYGCWGAFDVETMLRYQHALEVAIADPSIDIAVVATQAVTRLDVVLPLLRAGIHCIVEKPFALSPEDAWTMVRVAQENNVLLSVHHQQVFGSPYIAAKGYIDEGMIGKLEAMYTQCKRRLGPYDLVEMAGHNLHLMHSIAGMPFEVSFALASDRGVVAPMGAAGAYEIEPSVRGTIPGARECGKGLGSRLTALYRFPNDVLGYLSLVPDDDPEEQRTDFSSVLFQGSRGRVLLFQRQAFYHSSQHDTPATMNQWDLIGGSLNVVSGGLEKEIPIARRFAEDFRDSLRGNIEPRVRGIDGAHIVEMTVAAYWAHIIRGVVPLPLQKPGWPLYHPLTPPQL